MPSVAVTVLSGGVEPRPLTFTCYINNPTPAPSRDCLLRGEWWFQGATQRGVTRGAGWARYWKRNPGVTPAKNEKGLHRCRPLNLLVVMGGIEPPTYGL